MVKAGLIVHAVLVANLFFVSSLIVGLLIYFRSRPKKLELAVTLALAFALAAVCFRPEPLYVQGMLLLGYWSIGSIFLQLILPFFQKAEAPHRSLVGQMLFAPAGAVLTVLLLAVCARLTPLTLDLYLYAFDGSLGFQPAFSAARFLLQNEWLKIVAEIVYMNLPVGLALVYFGQQRISPVRARHTLALYLALGAVGYACYFIFPAVGCAVFFRQDFPFHPTGLLSRRLGAVAAADSFPRNCIPSLHASWALAMLWSARSMTGWKRIGVAAFAALTWLYAASCGHYIVDLIVAVPFTLAIYALTRGKSAWQLRSCQVAFGSGAILVVAWVISLRWTPNVFLASRIVPWAAILFTLVISIMLRTRLDRALEEAGAESSPPHSDQVVVAVE